MKNVGLFKNQILIVGICVFVVVLSYIGGSYALFTSSSKAGEYNSLTVGDLEISYVDTGAGYGDVLSLNGAYPMSNTDGANTTPYRFSLENKGTIPIDLRIKLLDDESIISEDNCGSNLIDRSYVMMKFDTNEPIVLGTLSDNEYTIYTKTGLVSGSSEIHEIRIWIKSDAPNSVLGKHFHGKMVVETNQTGVEESLTKTYHIGSSVTLADNSKWHVLEEAKNSSSIVKLISDYNLNSDGTFCTSGTCSTYAFDTVTDNEGVLTPSRPAITNSYCVDETNGCNMYNKNGNTVIQDSTIKTWLQETYLPILKSNISNSGVNGVTLEDLTVSIPSMEELALADGKSFTQHILTLDSTYLNNSVYWTKTASNISTSAVWYVGSGGTTAVKNAKDNNSVGLRVVITTSKLNLK